MSCLSVPSEDYTFFGLGVLKSPCISCKPRVSRAPGIAGTTVIDVNTSMRGKRRRTAWDALDDARVDVFSPSRTTNTPADSAILVTSISPNDEGCELPPKDIFTQARPDSQANDIESPQKTPSSTQRFTQQTPQSHIKARLRPESDDDHDNDSDRQDCHSGKCDSPDFSTPLVVSRQDIVAARMQLRMSPSTPSSQLTVFLDPQAAKEARALLSSAKRRRSQVTPESDFATRYLSPRTNENRDVSGDTPSFDSAQRAFSPPLEHAKLEDTVDAAFPFETNPNSQSNIIPVTHQALTPMANRRASTGSAVTPLPLRLEESPQLDKTPNNLERPARSTLTTQPPPPPPVLPPELQQKISSPITPAVRSANEKSSAVATASPTILAPSETNDKSFGFTTAAGRALRPSAVPAAFADLFDTPAEPKIQPSSGAHLRSDISPQNKRTEPNPPKNISRSMSRHRQPSHLVEESSANSKNEENRACLPGHDACQNNAGGAPPPPNAVENPGESRFTVDTGNPVDVSLFTTGKGAPIEPPLFTTGAGKPVALNVLQSSAGNVPDTSLLRTGHGKPIHLSMRPTVGKPAADTALFSTGLGKANEVPLFTTGGGKPVGSVLLAHANANSDVDTPLLKSGRECRVAFALDLQQSDPGKLSAKSNGSSTFRTPSPAIRLGFSTAQAGTTSSAGFSVPGRCLASTEQRRAFRGLATPSGKTPPTDELRKMLFNDSGRGRNAGKRLCGRGRQVGVASGLKTTPFKSPRIIRRSKILPKPTEINIPRPLVPRLNKTGGFICANENCACREQSRELECNESLFGDFHVMKECQAFIFPQSQWGCVQCLPDNVKNAKSLWCSSSFGVGNCITWIHELFGMKKEKGAATCVGSDAWVYMSYALAVYKLWRLSLEKGAKQSYLSAAGVVRELLRRIEKEWHGSKQPWLLRIMRGDTNAGCHFVGKIVEFEVFPDGEVMLVITDGWYVARARLDASLKTMVTKGWLRAGERVHLMGASLQTRESTSTKEWVFGAGDELSNGVLKLHRNSVYKVRESRQGLLKMGVQPMVFIKNLKCVIEDAGLVSGITVVILRSYALCYMESKVKVVAGPDGEDEQTVHIWRREEAEEAARLEHESEALRKRLVREERCRRRNQSSKKQKVEHQESDKDADEQGEIAPRHVTPVQELLVCGVGDDASDRENRKLLRVFNCSEEMDRLMQRPGTVLHVRNVAPRKRGVWTCRPDGICEAKSNVTVSPRQTVSRTVATVEDLKNGVVGRGCDFDGVFYVVYRAIASNHFVYLSDDTGDAVSLVALQVCPSDAEFMPRALLPSGDKDPDADETFPIVVMTDITFESELADLEVVHARTTLRTSISAPRKTTSSTLRRKSAFPPPLEERVKQLERRLNNTGETRTQLQILREAVASFCSGQRPSVAAYFSSTQEV